MRLDGHLLLSDFGIAKILEGTTNLTRVGTGIGTPQYMSPEQGTGQPVDRRSDIYSLGIVLYHALTGRVPFTADSPLSITVKHLNDPLPIENLRGVGVPQPVEQVLLKMSAKAPADRYQTTDALIEALTRALTASQLTLPRWRSGVQPIGSPASIMDQQQAAFSGPSSNVLGAWDGVSQPMAPSFQSLVPNMRPSFVTVPCFRCGAANQSDRLFCTSCGYELSDKWAAADRYIGPNGRPLLAKLSLQNGQMAGRSYLFHQVVTTIGRTNGNDLIISGRTVSRRHAQLWFEGGRWYLADMQSANGTLINNMRLQPNQAAALNDGDVINFGDEVALTLLRTTSPELAIHERCGTNLAVTAMLTGLSAMLVARMRRPYGTANNVILATMASMILSRPLGLEVQRHFTTQTPGPSMTITGVRPLTIFGTPAHFVSTDNPEAAGLFS